LAAISLAAQFLLNAKKIENWAFWIAADLVYVPLVTPLIRAAKARELRTADGLGMLMCQAVRGFTLWFGKKPAVTAELRALLEGDLGPSAVSGAGIT